MHNVLTQITLSKAKELSSLHRLYLLTQTNLPVCFTLFYPSVHLKSKRQRHIHATRCERGWFGSWQSSEVNGGVRLEPGGRSCPQLWAFEPLIIWFLILNDMNHMDSMMALLLGSEGLARERLQVGWMEGSKCLGQTYWIGCKILRVDVERW